MRLLELTLLGLIASVVFAVSAMAGIPAATSQVASVPVVQPGSGGSSQRSFERPQPVELPAAHPVVTAVRAPAVTPTRVVQRHLRNAPITRPAAVKPSAVTKSAPADSYPHRSSQTNAHDAWGFTQRQCVSYAAWRLGQAGHAISNDRDGWGSASGWDDAARRLGFASDRRPSVGAIAQWEPGERSRVWAGTSAGSFTAGGYGHVGFVTEVYPDGSVQVAQYNATGDRAFSSMRMTAPRFLHVV